MSSRRGFVVLVLLALALGRADALPADSSAIRSDLRAAASDAARILLAPVHFGARDWTLAAGVVGGTAVLFTLDRTARVEARRLRSGTADDVMSAGREYGREIYGLSLAGGLYAGGLVFGHEPTRTTGRMLFESVVLAGLANMTLKSVIGRSRPQTEEGPFRFRGFQTALERTSLPSGHSTVAFAVSSVLARRIDNPYATVGLYGMAALTAVSRIYHDNHWLSDTFLGAAIGTSVGLAVAGGGEETSVSIEPSGSGLRLSYRF